MGVALRKDSRALEHASYAGLSEKWVSACDLKHGDKVLLSDGMLCEVEGVTLKQLETPETTYNLEVDDFHTYYVSDACVLVHNAGTCGKGIDNQVKEAKEWLGDDAKILTNKSGDKIFLSKDGTRRLRFDLNNPKPHSNPHAHVEYKTGSNTWHKSGPLWPKDVIPK